jgi:phosphoglucomutase
MGYIPERHVMVKTIVTTEMAQRIAERYNVETGNVLTGFKEYRAIKVVR